MSKISAIVVIVLSSIIIVMSQGMIKLDKENNQVKEKNESLSNENSDIKDELEKNSDMLEESLQEGELLKEKLSKAKKNTKKYKTKYNNEKSVSESLLKDNDELKVKINNMNIESSKKDTIKQDVSHNKKSNKKQLKTKSNNSVEKSKVVTSNNSKAEKPKQDKTVKATSTKNNSNAMTIEMTAYGIDCNGCTGITASGVDVRSSIYHKGMRVIAVDPSVIPLGSIVEIELNGDVFKAIALDTGGAIKGNIVDLLVESEASSSSFGRQSAKLTIIK